MLAAESSVIALFLASGDLLVVCFVSFWNSFSTLLVLFVFGGILYKNVFRLKMNTYRFLKLRKN